MRLLSILTSSVLTLSLLFGTCLAQDWVQDNDSDMSIQVLKATLSKTDIENLGLREVLTIAQEENQNYKSAVANVGIAKARYQERLASVLPDLIFTSPFSHFKGGLQVLQGDILAADRQNTQPQMIMRFTMLQGGAQILQSKMAKKTLEAQKQTEQAVLQDVLRQTALSYYALQRSLANIVISRKQVEESQANLELNKSRLANGTGTELDVLQSENQLLEAQDQLLDAVKASEEAGLELNNMLNLPTFVQVAPADAMAMQPQTLVDENSDINTLLKQASQSNPQLKAMQSQLMSLVQLFKPSSMMLAMMPEVYTQVRMGRLNSSTGASRSFNDTAFAVGLTLNNLTVSKVFQYKEVKGQILDLKAQLESQRNLVERDLSQTWLTAKTKQMQIDLAHQKLSVAEATYLKSVSDLKSGQGRNLDTLAAQTSLTQARRNLNNRVFEYNEAQVNLVHHLGIASIDTLTKGVLIQ